MKLRKANHAFSDYSSDLVLTEHGRFDTDGQNNGWRSEAAIIEALPLRVNDLRGSRVVKGKSRRWREEGRRQLPLEMDHRCLTSAAPLHCETKGRLSLSPSSFFKNLFSFLPALCLPTLSLLRSMIHFSCACVYSPCSDGQQRHLCCLQTANTTELCRAGPKTTANKEMPHRLLSFFLSV